MLITGKIKKVRHLLIKERLDNFVKQQLSPTNSFYKFAFTAITLLIPIRKKILAYVIFKKFELTVKAATITSMKLLKGFWAAVVCVDNDNGAENLMLTSISTFDKKSTCWMKWHMSFLKVILSNEILHKTFVPNQTFF